MINLKLLYLQRKKFENPYPFFKSIYRSWSLNQAEGYCDVYYDIFVSIITFILIFLFSVNYNSDDCFIKPGVEQSKLSNNNENKHLGIKDQQITDSVEDSPINSREFDRDCDNKSTITNISNSTFGSIDITDTSGYCSAIDMDKTDSDSRYNSSESGDDCRDTDHVSLPDGDQSKPGENDDCDIDVDNLIEIYKKTNNIDESTLQVLLFFIVNVY